MRNMPIAMVASSSPSSSCSALLLHSNHHSNNTLKKSLHISTTVRNGFGRGIGNDSPLHHQLRAPTRRNSSHRFKNRELVFRMNAGPDDKAKSAAADFLASNFSISSIPELLQNPWVPGIAGLLVGTTIPFLIEKMLLLAERIDSAAEAVEKVADKVVEVAEEVEKKAEELEKSLPEGALRKVVSLVEDLAEETAENAQKVSDMMDKVDEMTDTLQDRFEDEPPKVPQVPKPAATMGFSQTRSSNNSQSPQCEISRFLRFFDF